MGISRFESNAKLKETGWKILGKRLIQISFIPKSARRVVGEWEDHVKNEVPNNKILHLNGFMRNLKRKVERMGK
jgi:hypothetical protein